MRLQTGTFALAALPAAAAHAAPATPGATFKADFLRQLDGVEKKLLDLIEATPQEKFGYKPDAVTRTTAEVFLHQASVVYLIGGFAGLKAPAVADDYEKSTTDKAKIAAEVKKAFDWMRDGAGKLTDADLAKPVKMFGQERTVQGALFQAALHMHEHLGQSIAYARASGITPPWSKKE